MPARITNITLTCNASSGGAVSLQCQGQPVLNPQVMSVNEQRSIPMNMVFSPYAQVLLTIVEPGLPDISLDMNVGESPTVQQEFFNVFFAAYTVACHVAQP